jgi:folate-binding protein YgfZ
MMTWVSVVLMGVRVHDVLNKMLTTQVVYHTHLQCSALLNRQGRLLVIMAWQSLTHDSILCVLPADMYEVFFKAMQSALTLGRVTCSNVTPCMAPQISPLPWLPITLGWLHAKTAGCWTVHEFGAVHAHLVSFNKGCFIGQEIVARMQYRTSLQYFGYFIPTSLPLLSVLYNAEQQPVATVADCTTQYMWCIGKVQTTLLQDVDHNVYVPDNVFTF